MPPGRVQFNRTSGFFRRLAQRGYNSLFMLTKATLRGGSSIESFRPRRRPTILKPPKGETDHISLLIEKREGTVRRGDQGAGRQALTDANKCAIMMATCFVEPERHLMLNSGHFDKRRLGTTQSRCATNRTRWRSAKSDISRKRRRTENGTKSLPSGTPKARARPKAVARMLGRGRQELGQPERKRPRRQNLGAGRQ